MVFNNVKIHHLIYFMTTILLKSSQAQTAGPTFTTSVSIVPGSTSLFSISKASSINLTSDFITGLPTPTPTPTPSSIDAQPTEIIFVTASTNSAVATSSSINSIPTNSNSSLNASDLGGIIGGCAGGLLLLSLLTACCCIKHRKKKKRAKKEVELGRGGISASMIFTKDAYKQQPGLDEPNTTVKRYNLDMDKTQVEEVEQVAMTPPVILYTDVHNQPKKINNSTSPQPRQLNRSTSQVSKGARLSKYNFLSQAFSQMRTSYGGPTTLEEEEYNNKNHASHGLDEFENQHPSIPSEEAAPEPSYQQPKQNSSSYHDSMILSSYEVAGNPTMNNNNNRYQMYSMYGGDTTTTSILQPPAKSFSPIYNQERESSVTVGTLHAPLFRNQRHQNPTPPLIGNNNSKNFYTSGVITPRNFNRDSLTSDVSQYPSSPTTTTTTSTSKPATKHYPYF